MKRLIFFFALIISLFTFTGVKAENAQTILDKTASAFKKSGDLKIGFTINMGNQNASGSLSLSGKKFMCNMGSMITWFNGKTMWNYVVANEEVDITNPGAAEVARMNPYSFLGLYKKGYQCSMGKSTANEYEVILKGKTGAAFTSVVVRVNKKSYQPTYIKTVASRTTMVITVNSFKKNQKFASSVFSFNKKKYPNVEVVDLR